MSRTYKDAPNRIKLARGMERHDCLEKNCNWCKPRFVQVESRKQRERLAIRFELQNN